jgi:hypothetical protein
LRRPAATIALSLVALGGGACASLFAGGQQVPTGSVEAVAEDTVAAVPEAGDALGEEVERVVATASEAPAPMPARAEMQSFHEGGHEGGARRVAMEAHAPLAAPDPSEKLVVNGTVAVRTVDVAALVLEVRAHAAEVGGVVVGENIRGNAEEGHASMRLRLPPPQAVPFADWLATRATLGARNVSSEGVTRRYLDQELALKNLQITMGRLQALAQRPDAPLKDVLEAERELTRVRGEIERLEGEHRMLDDQIARATLTVEILPRRGAHPPPVHVEPELKFELVPRYVTTHFLDARGRSPNRWGVGATLMFARSFSLDFAMLPKNGVEARSFLLDGVVGGYSDYLGGGRRRFLNPFLAARVGGGLLLGHGAFDFGADAGVELVHYEHFILEVSGRGQWFVYHGPTPYDFVLSATAGIGVPF